jgi:hypothetical protein
MRRSHLVHAAALFLSMGVTGMAQERGPAPGPSVVAFAEPGFPPVDVPSLLPLPGAEEVTSVSALADALSTNAVLVWRHGSAFPFEAWEPIQRFLERGGALVHLGGEPFTRPVVGAPGNRVVQPRTVSMLKALRLNQCYRVDATRAEIVAARGSGVALDRRRINGDAWVAVLEPRLADAVVFRDEDGSPGARDAILRPLLHLRRPADDPRFPGAAAAFAIDRLQGPWAGGRWVFWLVSVAPTDDERDLLLREAARRPADFRVDPTFGTFHESEQPSVILRLHRPLATDAGTWPVKIHIEGPAGARSLDDVSLAGERHATARVPLPGTWSPGLYRVTAEAPGLPVARTGFWIFDRALFTSGSVLTFDEYTLRRDDRTEPVVGTTLMSPTVHRDFLFEPDAATWDDTFAELASLHVNMVRTGVWSGWRKISLEHNVVDEAFLRALEAYYLTARRHGIPVVFTFFAFLPERFGGENPFFDPRALEGQRAYVSAIASRFAAAHEVVWDFINEPSFSSPRQLGRTRPHGDRHELEAFLAWLERRYGDGAPAGHSWQDVVRTRWRLLPPEPVGLPTDADFEVSYLMGDARPYRAVDYTLFAQEAFGTWVQQMTAAVRSAGSRAPVSVGQDEGGLTTRPGPLYHHRHVAFTSMHTWWNNDALLWDGVLAKATGKPMLVSETGIMQRELLSGDAVRDPEQSAQLLARKIGYAFAAGAFGVIQWCYDVNPYMPSDNEVAIGLRRVDGSYKPEHRVFRDVAAFVARHRARFDGYVEPQVALVVSSSEMFSARDQATGATRAAVRTLFERLAVPARAVAEYRAETDLGAPRAIVLPATRGVPGGAWNAIVNAVDAGAHLIASGWFETDDVGLPAKRLGVARRPLAPVEDATIGATHSRIPLRFPGTLPESWFAAAGEPRSTSSRHGAGAIHHHPLPLEWADRQEATEAHYRAGLADAAVKAVVELPDDAPVGCLVRVLPFTNSLLVVAVNEASADAVVRLRYERRDLDMAVPAGGLQMAFVDRRTGTIERLSAAVPQP